MKSLTDNHKKPSEFTMHDIMQVAHETSMAVIGKINSTDLNFLKEIPDNQDAMGFESDISNKDKELSEKHSFNIDACITENDSVLFDFSFSKEDGLFREFIASKYPEVFDYHTTSTMLCDVFFANVHDDKDVISSRGQLMFVLENNIGHKLYSMDDKGNEHILIPQAGDIVFLDISCPHAVLPNQSEGMEAMRKNSFRFVSINYG